MKFTQAIETFFKKFLPSPFAIALLLTALTILLALLFTNNTSESPHFLTILSYWESGIWNNNLLVFGYQMMLILVLGHILVLSTPVNKLITKLTNFVTNTANAVILVSLTTMLVSFFNWGLGLIFGAILARKVAEAAQERNFPINYPLVGAAGYCGLMIWHGGISGSAPLKVAEQGHLQTLMQDISTAEIIQQLPTSISFSETVFSGYNLIIFAVLLMAVPGLLYVLSKKAKPTSIAISTYLGNPVKDKKITGADRLDHSKYVGSLFGVLIIIALVYQYKQAFLGLKITPNLLNFFMLGLALLCHRSIANFLHAVEEAIKGASGILIQFPLYFGIMGIMKDSGMVVQISDFFVSIATPLTLPIVTFFSAGLVNIFVPSGGGQWAIQGPIVIESALKLGVPLPKMIMALSYGDQVTNMLQPFWALPLLGITQLKARDILPYTVLIMLVGTAIFITGLLLFSW